MKEWEENTRSVSYRQANQQREGYFWPQSFPFSQQAQSAYPLGPSFSPFLKQGFNLPQRRQEPTSSQILPHESMSAALPPPNASLTAEGGNSSSIDSEAEDAEILRDFFAWKQEGSRSRETAEKWGEISAIVLNADWSIAELKSMADGEGQMYRRARQAGISDGIARRFRGELQAYKKAYRQQNAENEQWNLGRQQGWREAREGRTGMQQEIENESVQKKGKERAGTQSMY